MEKRELQGGADNAQEIEPNLRARPVPTAPAKRATRPAPLVGRTIHWGSVVIRDHQDLRRLLTEQRRLEKALEHRTQALEAWLEVLRLIPKCDLTWCPAYGGICLPHALGWILAHRQADAERLKQSNPGTALPGNGAVVPGASGRVRTDRSDTQDE